MGEAVKYLLFIFLIIEFFDFFYMCNQRPTRANPDTIFLLADKYKTPL